MLVDLEEVRHTSQGPHKVWVDDTVPDPSGYWVETSRTEPTLSNRIGHRELVEKFWIVFF